MTGSYYVARRASRSAARLAGASRALRTTGSSVLELALLLLILTASGCVRKAKPKSDTRAEATTSAPAATLDQTGYGKAERLMLLGLARDSLRQAVLGGKPVTVPAGVSQRLLVSRGCFVTLTVRGELRGCIGNIFPEKPLAQAVIDNACLAALNDSRFSPVTPDEVARIEIEVSVLTLPAPLRFDSPEELSSKLRPHRDGVVLKIGLHRATFLPQVWEQLPDANDFLNHLSAKAGLTPQAWREPGTEIMTYQVDAFKESEIIRD